VLSKLFSVCTVGFRRQSLSIENTVFFLFLYITLTGCGKQTYISLYRWKENIIYMQFMGCGIYLTDVQLKVPSG
jgi:hypothetical protein